MIPAPDVVPLSWVPFAVGAGVGVVFGVYLWAVYVMDETDSCKLRVLLVLPCLVVGQILPGAGAAIVANVLRTKADEQLRRDTLEQALDATLVVTEHTKSDPLRGPRSTLGVRALPRDPGREVETRIWRDGTVYDCTVLMVNDGWAVTCIDADGQPFAMQPDERGAT
ncbi:MAG: hypothetical protein IE923_03620 [Micrococcales bacterium]|nr:hypothetical protein [Micrococcales bacterium]